MALMWLETGGFCEDGDGTPCAIKLEEVKVNWRNVHNEEHHDVHPSRNKIMVIK
jgi:hypothetical protein